MMKKIALEDLKPVLLKAIPPKYPYWVLLSNGTFLVLETAVAKMQKDLNNWVNELLMEFDHQKLTVFTFVDDIVHVSEYGGWIVTNRSGAYTFVHASEFNENEPSELAISVKGCLKFLQDCTDKEILHIETPKRELLGNR